MECVSSSLNVVRTKERGEVTRGAGKIITGNLKNVSTDPTDLCVLPRTHTHVSKNFDPPLI